MKKRNMIIIGLTILVAGGIFVGFVINKNKKEENNKTYPIKYLKYHYDGGMENTYYLLTYDDSKALIEEDDDGKIKKHKVDVEKLNNELAKFMNKYNVRNWIHKENEYELLDASTSSIKIECDDGFEFALSDSEYIPQNKLNIMNDFKKAMESAYK